MTPTGIVRLAKLKTGMQLLKGARQCFDCHLFSSIWLGLVWLVLPPQWWQVNGADTAV